MTGNLPHIPFHREMLKQVFLGNKFLTTRTKNYFPDWIQGNGLFSDVYDYTDDAGDLWFIYVQWNFVFKTRLGIVRDSYYKQEGFKTPEEFESFWGELHPRKKFSAIQPVWVHRLIVLERTKVTKHRSESNVIHSSRII
jgi:hypothetical protein